MYEDISVLYLYFEMNSDNEEKVSSFSFSLKVPKSTLDVPCTESSLLIVDCTPVG